MFRFADADALHLKYSHENGCSWDKKIGIFAALNGHRVAMTLQLRFSYAEDLDALHLKYTHEHGCHWDENTCSDAAFNGRLDCLKYAYIHRCPGYEKYHNQIKHLLLTKNLEVYYRNCLIVRKVLKSYIEDFKERYYSPNGIGFHKRKDHFESFL